METLFQLSAGIVNALSPELFLLCFAGVAVGMLVGVLPGIGAIAAISLALPITFHLDATGALVMLAGIFYGTQYGGSTSSILLNLPGTATSAVTCLDGYPLAKQGKAGMALFITTIASFIGASLAIVVMIVLTPALSKLAMRFSAAEYFSVMLLGLVAASTLSTGSALKGFIMMLVGLALGLVGLDVNSGEPRLTFGLFQLMDGISLVALSMGLFGVSEVFASMGDTAPYTRPAPIRLRDLIPTRAEFRMSLAPTARGSVLGTILGSLPGMSAAVTSFMAYALERKLAKNPERFGKGAIEGVAAPEAANNASVQASFIPTLSLGIPGDPVMAILLGAMMIHGIVPGPRFMADNAGMFWSLIGSFWVGNLLLLLLNIPLVGLWVKVLSIPRNILYPAVMFFVCIGVYSIRSSEFDVILTLVFGLVGYAMNRFHYPAAPLLLGFVLGPMMEENLTRALVISRGSLLVFVQRPISAAVMACVFVLLVLTLYAPLRARRRKRALADYAS